MHGCRSLFVAPPEHPGLSTHPVRLILTLSVAAMVDIGIGRFAYALVLPDMRDSLHWSYAAAGFMNTVNAAGYLAGALMASQLIRRFGWSVAIAGGTLACLASLAVCAITGNFVLLGLARLIIGLGGRNWICRQRRARGQHRPIASRAREFPDEPL